MPVYNSIEYISDAIESVINQKYNKWELFIIDDGSIYPTEEIIKEYDDERILYFRQSHHGVSFARNLALKKISGDYFCFLDSDDVMPADSLFSRIKVFKRRGDISFVDGSVIYMNDDMTPTGKIYTPSFTGDPYYELLKLNRACYFGNTWMIKREPGVNYQFSEGMTHAEDLFFYLTIAKDRKYAYTEGPVLYYRERENSAMKNLEGLEQGYLDLLKNVRKELNPDPAILQSLKKRIMRIMFLSHLFDGRDPCGAARSLFRYLLKA